MFSFDRHYITNILISYILPQRLIKKQSILSRNFLLSRGLNYLLSFLYRWSC